MNLKPEEHTPAFCYSSNIECILLYSNLEFINLLSSKIFHIHAPWLLIRVHQPIFFFKKFIDIIPVNSGLLTLSYSTVEEISVTFSVISYSCNTLFLTINLITFRGCDKPVDTYSTTSADRGQGAARWLLSIRSQL